MYLRCAYFEGDVPALHRKQFDAIMNEQIAPTMLTFPGLLHLRILWGREHETPERHLYLVIEHGYDSLEALGVAITSEARTSMQSALDELMPLFDGRVYHVNYDAKTFHIGNRDTQT
jgi:hypothetical protein